MGTRTAAAITSDLRLLLQDTSNVSQRWSDSALRLYLDTAILRIVTLLPHMNSTTYVHTLTPGVHQSLPADAVSYIGVLGNLNPSTEAFTSTVTPFDVAKMDASFPSWRNTATSQNRVYQAAPDPGNAFKFYVYPAASGKISVQYAFVPPKLATAETLFPLSDILEEAAIYYAAHSALIVDADNDRSAAQAGLYRQTFYSLLALPDPAASKASRNG